MRDENKIWSIRWTQPYAAWPKPEPEVEQEPEIKDVTQAREVLARIMSL